MDKRLTEWLSNNKVTKLGDSNVDMSKVNIDASGLNLEPSTLEEFNKIESLMCVLPPFKKGNLVIRTKPWGSYSYTWECC